MATSELFTFILEFRGGTYISQVRAASIDAAIVRWAEDLPADEITHLGPKLKQRLIAGLKDDTYQIYEATPLAGLTNVWHVNVPLPGGAGTTLNAVKTSLR